MHLVPVFSTFCGMLLLVILIYKIFQLCCGKRYTENMVDDQ